MTQEPKPSGEAAILGIGNDTSACQALPLYMATPPRFPTPATLALTADTDDHDNYY